MPLRAGTSDADLYERLRRCNPASHAALLRWEGGSILSASPELFLRLRTGRAISRPIKGTRARSSEAALDASAREELLHSEKDRAELTMIIDLVRNDLGKVCVPGGVHVPEPYGRETHPTVHHLVATVEGRLAEGRTWADLLQAAFPGGSITGAPKIRAMQIIDEMEPTARGVYCGAIGWIGLDGDMHLNLAIRTLVRVGGEAFVHTGGGIVADSDPEDEYEETCAKVRGLLAALGATEAELPRPCGEGVRP